MSEEVEEQAIPPTSAAVLAEITVIARGLMRQAEASGVTSDISRTLEGLRKIAMSGMQLEIQEAKVKALQTERQVDVAVGRKEQLLSLFETILEGLSTPEGIERMRNSISHDVEELRKDGVRWKRPSTSYDGDLDEG